MINFRYHVVSIVAVFLALAVGIVLGSTQLSGGLLDHLDTLTSSLRSNLQAAHANNNTLKQQVNGDQAFATAAAPRLLSGLLTGQKVVLVVAPSAPGNVVSGVTTALTQAGAKVTGQVSLQPLVFDPSASNQSFLSTIVNTLATNSHVEPANGSPLAQASWMLGSAILTKNDPSSGTQTGKSSSGAGTTGESVLSSYAQAGLLSVTSGQPGSDPATLAVVVTPSTIPSDGDSDSTNQGLVTMAQELNTAGLGTVMVGSASGSVSGSAISTLRGSNAAAQISSVDDADTEIGQIVTVQALAQDLSASHKTGSYGVDPGSNAAGPNPAPTPAASTPTTTTTQAQSQGSARKSSSTGKKT